MKRTKLIKLSIGLPFFQKDIQMKYALSIVMLLSFPSLSLVNGQSPKKPTEQTKLESFQSAAGSVLVKNFSEIGKVIGLGVVTVTDYEFVDPQTGKKEYGIGLDVRESGTLDRSERAYIDYDEIDSLISGIDYISKVNKGQSKLKNFEAHYKTKGDLDIATYSSRDRVEAVIAAGRIGGVSCYLQLDKLQKVRQLIIDAKAVLDAIK